MKTYRCYNTKLTELESWPVTDKTPVIEVFDEDNGYCFEIRFGENPSVTVFDLKNGELGRIVNETFVER